MEHKTNAQTLSRYGDMELWYASGDNWSLPLNVWWKMDRANNLHYAMIAPAVGLYTSQALLLDALFQAHDIQGRQDQWVIPRRMVDVLIHKAPGVTPVFYYRWPDDAMPPLLPPSKDMLLRESVTAPKGSGKGVNEEFVRHVCEQYKLPSSVVRIVLRAIGDEGARWMLETHQPIELGFCRLLAVPFRSNWKEIVAAKFKHWKLLKLLKLPRKVRHAALEEAGVPQALCSPHNIGIRRKNLRIQYTLEAIPTKSFETAVSVAEGKRQACGHTSYVASFEAGVEKMYHALLEAMEKYLEKTTAPFARVYESSDTGLLGFLPSAGSKIKIHGVAVRKLPVIAVQAESNFSVLAESPGGAMVHSKASPLRQVPRVLPAPADVRQCPVNGTLGGPEGPGQGWETETQTAGLPVLSAGQSGDAGGKLLPL